MCQNYTRDVQTQVVSAFGGVSATDREVGSNHCRDEKRTESNCPNGKLLLMQSIWLGRSNHCRDEKRTESGQHDTLGCDFLCSNHCRDECGLISV